MDKLLFPYAPVLWLDISETEQLFYGIKRLPDLKHILLIFCNESCSRYGVGFADLKHILLIFLLMISVSAPVATWAIRSRDLEWVKED